LPIYALTGFFVCIDFFQTCELFRKKEDIHLKPLTPGEVARLTVTERAVCGGRTQFIPTVFTASFQLRRGDLWSPVLQHGGSKPTPYGIRLLFFSIHSKKKRCGRDAASHCTHQKALRGPGTQSQVSRRLFCFFFLRLKKEDNGQPRTSVPTVRKQAFIFSHTKRALRARRVKQTVQWTVCSQSGEQFIIATRGFKPGTQPR